MSLKITRQDESDIPSFSIAGEINEEKNILDPLLVPGMRELRVSCKGVRRINSIGVKSWIQFFTGLRSQGVRLRFTECSSAVIQQANLFPNFLIDGEIESLYAPFLCEDCGKESDLLFTLAELQAKSFEISEQNCGLCNGKAVFDDMPEDYFHVFMGSK